MRRWDEETGAAWEDADLDIEWSESTESQQASAEGRVQPPPVPRVKTSEFMCDPYDTCDVYTRVWRHVPVYLCSGNVSNVCGKWLRANVGASIHSPEPEPGHWSETLLLLRLRAPTLASCGLILPRGGGSHVSTPPRSTINPKLIVIKNLSQRM